MQRRNPGRFLLRAAVVLVCLLPLVWMVTAALHPVGTPLPRTLRLLPEVPSLRNFGRAADLIPLGRYTVNSLVVVAIAVPLTLLTSSWAGFAIAQLPPGSQRRWLIGSLLLLMVPGIALWMPRFLVYRSLHLLNTPLALAAPAIMGTSPFFVLMFYRAFRRLPRDQYDAARVDGAGVLTLWRRVSLPQVWATSWGVALLTFVFYWGDFTNALLYIRDNDRYTLPVGLRALQQLQRSEQGITLAAAVVATAIPVCLFALGQLFFARRARNV